MDIDFKQNLIAEFKEILSLTKLTLQRDWDLIWVLSAGEIDIKNKLETQKNETKERLETGIKLVKKITKLRTGKRKLSQSDIKFKGPKIYYSGYNDHNLLMRKNQKEKFFEDTYDFPGENIIVGPLEDILHTDHQFEKFPQKLIPKNKKIVIVTSAYHIPRCRRYLKKYPQKFASTEIIFYPSRPICLSEDKVSGEIKKIIDYTREGVLPTF